MSENGEHMPVKKDLVCSRAFGLALVWTLLIAAAVGTYVLTRGLEGRGDQSAAIYLSGGGPIAINLYRDRAEPSSVSARIGQEVLFTIRDESMHNIAEERTSRRDARLESGEFGEGESYSLVFSGKGTYSFYDRLNQSIRATVVVQ